jgi:hypothetical protein
MQITPEYIEEAERLLLPDGCHFDEERVRFINRWDSGDLLAVPGSGKTTALRAKLYCIAKNLPFPDERGVLVISHTNVAVDELKGKLQNSCPQLFEYPNFVGTIQDFIDTFLALPYYIQEYCHKVDYIDADIYERVCKAIMNKPGRETGYLSGKMVYANDYKQIRLGYDENGTLILTQGLIGEKVSIPVAPKWERENTVAAQVAKMEAFLFKMKETIMRYGILHFDDCYHLADTYIRKCPDIIDILRKRFAFVFVDEAQDMQAHQLEIVDRCFNCDTVVLQRIGDPNQSIYDGFSLENSWVGRNPFFINNSLRLTSNVADIVDHLMLDRGDNGQGGARFVVTGANVIGEPIKPHLLLYDWNTKGSLKERFKELIRGFNLQQTSEGKKYGFYIVGWNADKTNKPTHRRLEDIFPEYSRKLTRPNVTPDTLSELIQIGNNYNDFLNSRNCILDAFVLALRNSGQRPQDGRQFTRTKILSMISDKEDAVQQRFQEELLEGSKVLSSGRWSDAYNEIKRVVTKWLNDYFEIVPNERVMAFFEENFVPHIEEQNIQDADDIPITIGTVHSVKGSTHCATLYVETSYNNKYESEYVIEEKTTGRRPNRVTTTTSPFFKQDLIVSGKNAAMAKRMLYVGFSRPTHLLCYASDKSLWSEARLSMLRNAGWEVIRL